VTASTRIGVIGTGAMGRHHVRILSDFPGAELVGICDSDSEVVSAVAAEHGVATFDSVEELADRVEAIVLAVPTAKHRRLGVALLEAGKHLLVEKPIAVSLEEADALIEAAGDRVLAVGHVEFYNPAVQALLGLELPPGFLEIHRMAAFKPRSLDIDVVRDLMIHDLQVLHALDPSPVVEVRAKGINVLTERVDIANVRLVLESGCVANITASRISAESIRKLRVFFKSSYYSLDYAARTLRGQCLETNAPRPRIQADLPEVADRDALESELASFLAACRGERGPLVDGRQGRRALATSIEIANTIEAEAAERRGARELTEESHLSHG
jgi:predicted dehydrogenase